MFMHLIRVAFINPFIHVVTELVKLLLLITALIVLGTLIAIPTYIGLSAMGWDFPSSFGLTLLIAFFGAVAWKNAIINMPQYKNIRGRAISSMSKGWWSP
jgi:hypothetical protein